jgi:hypothetical protein
MEDIISQQAIDAIAKHINQRSNKQYDIPIIGSEDNIETPHFFEIVPFDKIDNTDISFFAIDGSYNSHSFYNGLSIGMYRAGYICFRAGKQIRMNTTDDPVILGKSYSPLNMLMACNENLEAIYDELLTLTPVKTFLDFLVDDTEKIFPYKKEAICTTPSTLLSFCQEILEWSLIFEIAQRQDVKPGDYILRDGSLRSVNIDQQYIVKLGKYLHEKHLVLIAVTKNSPTKIELCYTLKQIDNYLQDKLKPKYPFLENDPRRQKLCSWFEIPEAVLRNAYGSGSSGMWAKKSLTGGRGIGLYFAARLDYVEKLQNFDWVIIDVNILDAMPQITEKNLTPDSEWLQNIFYNLSRLTQEHYILGYPYPLVESHNFVTLSKDFKEEIINRVKHSMYHDQYMDHVDIENLFLDIHDRF